MERWISTVILTMKVLVLSCVSFMSTAGAAGIPCHEVVEKPDCQACVLSLDAWEEPLVAQDDPVLVAVAAVVTLAPATLETPFEITQIPQSILARAPPDEVRPVSLWAWQQTIRLRV